MEHWAAGGRLRHHGLAADAVVPFGINKNSLVTDLDVPAGVTKGAQRLSEGKAFKYWVAWFRECGMAKHYAKQLAWDQLAVSPFAGVAPRSTEANGDNPASR